MEASLSCADERRRADARAAGLQRHRRRLGRRRPDDAGRAAVGTAPVRPGPGQRRASTAGSRSPASGPSRSRPLPTTTPSWRAACSSPWTGSATCRATGCVSSSPVPTAAPARGRFPGFDRRSACGAFTFRQDCPGLVDCARPPASTPPSPAPPVIDYLARDYASLRRALLDRLALTVPDWRERHAPDLGITLVELLAYAGDELSYRQDAVATEAYLDTARRRASVRRHARLVDYRDARRLRRARRGSASRWRDEAGRPLPGRRLPVPRGPGGLRTGRRGRRRAPQGAQHHRPVDLGRRGVRAARRRDVGDPARRRPDRGRPATPACSRSRPATCWCSRSGSAPVTGLPADADRTHRQVGPADLGARGRHDPLYDQPLLEVTWDRADALTFPLCVRARGGPGVRGAGGRRRPGQRRAGRARQRRSPSAAAHPQTAHWPADAADPSPGARRRPTFGCPDDGPSAVPAYPPPAPSTRRSSSSAAAGDPARALPRPADRRDRAGRLPAAASPTGPAPGWPPCWTPPGPGTHPRPTTRYLLLLFGPATLATRAARRTIPCAPCARCWPASTSCWRASCGGSRDLVAPRPLRLRAHRRRGRLGDRPGLGRRGGRRPRPRPHRAARADRGRRCSPTRAPRCRPSP